MLFRRLIQRKQVDKVAPFHDLLKTLASDCVIKKDVTTVHLLIYNDKLYMLPPVKIALTLET